MDQPDRSKQILSDPVAQYSARYPQAPEADIRRLTTRWQRLQTLNKQRAGIAEQTKILSRRIGAAKRQGATADELKTSMREQSARLKAIDTEKRSIERELLDHFEPAQPNATRAFTGPPDDARRFSPLNRADIGVTISMLDREFDSWNRYVDNNEAASFYHRAEWRDLIRKTFGHETFYWLARDRNGVIRGILPIVRLRSRLFGDFMVSLPYFNYGGAIADHPDIETELMQAAREQASALNLRHIEYRDDVPRDDFPANTDKVCMILPLSGSTHDLWNGFNTKLRAQIKRAQREEALVVRGGESYLRDFYAVFARNMRDLGTPVYSESFFRNIIRYFPDNCCIIVVYLHKRPVAAGFLISHGRNLEIPWASTLREVNKLGTNMLLYWEVLKYATENGFETFDFGRSSKDANTYRFKKQWGAQPRQLYWHYWLAGGGALPCLNPSNPKYAFLVNVWRRLPVPLANRLGPGIVKNLP